jgi:phage virion morphogenesis protein
MGPITIEVKDDQILASLRKIAQELSRPTPALKLVGILAQRAIQRNFKAQSDPQGKPWARLSSATIKSRRNRKKSSIQILVDTGRLKNSLNTLDALRITGSEVAIGTNVKYAAIHNFGAGARSSVKTHRRFGAIPQREFMGVKKEDEQGIVDALNRYVERVIRQSGLK